MKVTLLYYTPLWLADKAIGKCHNKPTPNTIEFNDLDDKRGYEIPGCNVKRIDRVANKMKHSSTIEHISYNFDIDGISRACLQELARHRIASLSVKSTRYTLKELKDEKIFEYKDIQGLRDDHEEIFYRANKYLVWTGNKQIDTMNIITLETLRQMLNLGYSNDIAKYCLPEAYKTSLVWSINARSLQNFLALRTSKSALWEIRDLAYAIYKQIPEDHKFLFKDYITKK